MNIAIVVSDFNQKVTSRMLSVSKEKAESMKIKIKFVCKVPGAFDMPVIVDSLLRKKQVDGVITLGAVIKGQTKHDELISHATARALQDLSIKYQKPVALGITGPGMQERHAYARIRPVSERAVEAVIMISKEIARINK